MLDGKSIINEQSVKFLRKKDSHVVLYNLFFSTYFVIPFDPVYLSSGIVNIVLCDRDSSFPIGIWIFRYGVSLIRISYQNVQSRVKEIDRKSALVG